MLRLLPERLYAGLSGQGSWLASGANAQLLDSPSSLPADVAPAEALEVLLQAARQQRRARKLSVMLPSQSARCISLPWATELRSDEEKRAYAQAHFEQAGLLAGEGYAIHAEFRHFGAQGFAYAVPQQLLDDLHAVAARHALALTTVLPIAAVAHLAATRANDAALNLNLLIENTTVSALTMDRTGLRHFDAEPAVGGPKAALRRLMTRLAANASDFKGVVICAASDHEEFAGIVSAVAARTNVTSVTPSQWRRFL